jgi:two-component system nitrogen regulation response regulator GlnG
LSRAGFNVRATDNAATLIKWAAAGEGDVVLSDVHMGQEDIFNFIPELKKMRPDLPLIIMSANTSVMTALKSGKFGVFEYIPKPFDLMNLQSVIERAIGSIPENSTVKPSVQLKEIGPMIGKSTAMQPVYRGISDFMSGDVPVYIYGDVGTGKNLTTALIHKSGKREGKPFVEFSNQQSVDLLIEEIADGDLLIDRVDELTAEQQNVLLRALEKNENQPINQRFRVLSTGGMSIQNVQSKNRLRPELFSHLRGGQIYLPPLAERPEDIPDLAVFFLNENPDIDRKRKFSKSALTLLKSNVWDGNVRDLRNLVRALPLQYSDAVITDAIVASALREQFYSEKDKSSEKELFDQITAAARNLLTDAIEQGAQLSVSPYNQAMAWIEKPLIVEALKITNGNNVKAAELLGIHRNTLRMKIRALDIHQRIDS